VQQPQKVKKFIHFNSFLKVTNFNKKSELCGFHLRNKNIFIK